MSTGAVTAQAFVAALHAAHEPAERATVMKRVGPDHEVIGMRMRDVFSLAKRFSSMPLDQVESLFASSFYEVRLGAVCILDFRAKARRSGETERRQLYELYLGRHDRITTWDMVDRAAPSVVGGHLMGRSTKPLHDLARSPDPLRRRTAITAPLWFIRYGSPAELAEVFPLAAVLAADAEPLVSNAVGIALKHAGGRDPGAVSAFLDQHAGAMSRAAVRFAVDTLPASERARFVGR